MTDTLAQWTEYAIERPDGTLMRLPGMTFEQAVKELEFVSGNLVGRTVSASVWLPAQAQYPRASP